MKHPGIGESWEGEKYIHGPRLVNPDTCQEMRLGKELRSGKRVVWCRKKGTNMWVRQSTLRPKRKTPGGITMIKRKILLRRRDGHRQHYHVGRKQHYGMGVYVYRKSRDGKHVGDETPNTKLEGQMQYAIDKLTEDKGDIKELRVTDSDDYIAFHWKKDEGTTFPDKEVMFPRELDKQLDDEKLKMVKKLRDDEK